MVVGPFWVSSVSVLKVPWLVTSPQRPLVELMVPWFVVGMSIRES